MAVATSDKVTESIRQEAWPLSGEVDDYDQLLALMSDQFDAVIHFDETQALEPLERYSLWETGEAPETFPTGI